MFRLSNTVLGILNILSLLLSIPILAGGILLAHQGASECQHSIQSLTIAIGVFLLVVSLAGIIGGFCKVTWLLWIYLFLMFLFIVLLSCFTIFAFVVSSKGEGHGLAGKGYKEYRLEDFSKWMRDSVADTKDWRRIKSCLLEAKFCDSLIKDKNKPLEGLFNMHLSPVQSGCCKPSDDCNFKYVSPTNWTKTRSSSTTTANPDCVAWSNDPRTLCYDCKSCKAGVVASSKKSMRRSAIVNIIVIAILVIVYFIGVCAFRNSRKDSAIKHPST